MGRRAVAINVTSDVGQPVRLITAHLKSKLLTFPGGRFKPKDENERARFAAYALYRRAAESATLRTWATGVLGGSQPLPVILCGDLNDTVQAATTQLLLGPPGSEIDTRGFKIPDKGDARRLWNLAPLMPPGRNYSRINQGRAELIDHILVSYALVKTVDVTSVEAVLAEPLPSVTPEPTARLNEPSSTMRRWSPRSSSEQTETFVSGRRGAGRQLSIMGGGLSRVLERDRVPVSFTVGPCRAARRECPGGIEPSSSGPRPVRDRHATLAAP
jgi:hypothetical protein